ncbi:SPOR domain-containing protein [Pleomorphomonas sp. NRK KF1]|uniref:SPOR domain-containing protein n=1 Tax=Pleomorphomonas sp. NRK KF1 TaxID=2943000 RepID=UPI0020432DB2|nr:SPOR domain-containing protein [Pleomorphomonas sp. NRK KF1]MCM5551879.1 SPOR domain-containing protein [Pleomorphomonas sp. NRK KF1]
MVRSSAAEQSPMRPAVSVDSDHLADDERYYRDILNGREASEADMDQFVDALAAELEQDIASMNPVDVRTGQVYKPVNTRKASTAYDPWDDQALDEFMAEFERDGVDPVVDEFGVLPPHAGSVEAEQSDARGRRGLMTAAAAAVLVLAAGFAGWAFFGGGAGFGEAVVVMAPDGPYKVKPDPNAQEVVASAEGASVYDTVGGTPPKSEERLVARSGDVPALPAVTPHVSRITLPDGQEVEAELPTGFDPNETGPRRVRTVLVRPDGSLIETPADTAGNAGGASLPASDGAGQIIARSETAGDTPNDDTDVGIGLPPLASNNQTVASDASSTPQGLPSSNLTDASGQPMPINLAALANPEADPSVETTASVPTDASAPLPPVKPAAPSAAPSSGPLDLTAAASQPQPAAPTEVASLPAATQAAPTSGEAGAYVQLSSQRSEDAARSAFASLQRKYPSILGAASVDIQRADLGSKGVYYRARVGAPTKSAAVELCEQLRSAGGDCLIAR